MVHVTKFIRRKVYVKQSLYSQSLYGTKFIPHKVYMAQSLPVTKFIITKFIAPEHGKPIYFTSSVLQSLLFRFLHITKFLVYSLSAGVCLV
jgi:hypothetical protein